MCADPAGMDRFATVTEKLLKFAALTFSFPNSNFSSVTGPDDVFVLSWKLLYPHFLSILVIGLMFTIPDHRNCSFYASKRARLRVGAHT